MGGNSGRGRARWISGVLMWQAAALSLAAEPQLRQCPGTTVSVSYQQASDAPLVCAAVTQAVDFMDDQGFPVPDDLTIHVVDGPGGHLKHGELGRFDGDSQRTSILSYEAARDASLESPPFGNTMTRELYQSFVVHELAHAIAHPLFEISTPPVEAQEYIAYTVQLATTQPDLRQAILDRYPQPGFEDESEITELYYAFDPSAFGVKAYRHFTKLVDTRDFYRRLLSGAIRSYKPWHW